MAVNLPGRESRIDEAPLREMTQITTAVHDALREWAAVDRRLVFFGYSLGAVVAFEVAARQWTELAAARRWLQSRAEYSGSASIAA